MVILLNETDVETQGLDSTTGDDVLYSKVSSKETQHVYYVQGKPSMLFMDHGTNE